MYNVVCLHLTILEAGFIILQVHEPKSFWSIEKKAFKFVEKKICVSPYHASFPTSNCASCVH